MNIINHFAYSFGESSRVPVQIAGFAAIDTDLLAPLRRIAGHSRKQERRNTPVVHKCRDTSRLHQCDGIDVEPSHYTELAALDTPLPDSLECIVFRIVGNARLLKLPEHLKVRAIIQERDQPFGESFGALPVVAHARDQIHQNSTGVVLL
ncbi:hypothetical protein PG985_014131 [Apiospora marii]|uniref:uncharacterized protein n=1 Tax=Apiospora marii TaxID=335849 RepID=UPI00312E19A0